MDYKDLIDTIRTVISFRDSDCCNCEECIEAIAAIETLLEERDAAVSMLHGECRACKHNAGWHNVGKCTTCKHETAGPLLPKDQCGDNWEWRGPQKDG